jgi:hypothetical protein
MKQARAIRADIPACRTSDTREPMQLQLDHVMFPVYFNNAFLSLVERNWKERGIGRVFSEPQNPVFKGVYLQIRSFYVEHLSTVESEPYWSNALHVIVPTEHWPYYSNPALRVEHFLVPRFGCGFTLVSPEYPHLHSTLPKQSADGLTVMISPALAVELRAIGGVVWSLPPQVQVNDKLLHPHDIAVVDSNFKLVAPLFQANPVLRELL